MIHTFLTVADGIIDVASRSSLGELVILLGDRRVGFTF